MATTDPTPSVAGAGRRPRSLPRAVPLLPPEPLEVRVLFAFTAPYISEFMAANTRTLADSDNQFSDWIELHNPTTAAVDLGGWYLTDDAAALTKWKIPAGTTLAADGRRVIFASDKNRTNPASQLHTNFKLAADGEYLALVQPDGVTVAQAYEPKYPDQLDDVSYGFLNDVEQYFTTPTPGAANAGGAIGVVGDTHFDHDRGFYDQAFQVAITTNTPNATIRYTTNGDKPTATTGTVYAGPLTIGKTTTLRAAAFLAGYVSSDVDTQSYVFVDDVVRQTTQTTLDAGFPSAWGSATADYGMDPDVIGQTGPDKYNGVYAATIRDDLKSIPTLSVVLPTADMFGSNGIYTNSNSRGDAWERAASVELINPDGTKGFQVNAGIQMQGGAFRSDGLTKKHSFKIVFKDKYGPSKLQFPFFGPNATDEFDGITLRADANDGWMWSSAGARPLYARDRWGRDTQRAMGQPDSQGNAVHLYINGVYWGLYDPSEELDPTFASTYYSGGKDDWDFRDQTGVTFGNLTAWNTMLTLADAVRSGADEATRTAAFEKIQGNRPDGTDDPALQDYLDVDNLIDYMLVNLYNGNTDWPGNNWRAARLRTDTGVGTPDTGYKFLNWDVETALALTTDVNVDRTSVNTGAAQPYDRLRSSLEFRLKFADHVQKNLFDGGPLSVDPTNPAWDPAHPERNVPAARLEGILNQIRKAVVAESARWGDGHREPPYTKADWLAQETSLLTSYFPQRWAKVLQQLKNANLYPTLAPPTMSQHGGQVAAGYVLTMAGPAGGTVYYTLDGTDPRVLGGAVATDALTFPAGTTGPVTLGAGTTRVLARTRDAAGNWSALQDAVFRTAAAAGSTNLRVTEINYHPYDMDPSHGETFADADDYEFAELTNTSAQPISLAGVKFTLGVRFDFPVAATLAPGERAVVVKNEAAFRQRYGTGPRVLGSYTGNFANDGQLTILNDAAGAVIQSFRYNDHDSWPGSPDGNGPTLEIIDPAGDYNDSENWVASSLVGGTPGGPPVPALASLGVNDGAAQRSMVRSLTVTFDRPVPLASDGFTLTLRDPAGGAGQAVGLLAATQDGGRSYVLTFPDAGPSLADGVYDLSVPSVPAATRSFHRLFSDADGDGDSDNFDLLQLRATLLKPSTDPAYKWYFDYDDSGTVDNLDVFQVRSRRSKMFQGY